MNNNNLFANEVALAMKTAYYEGIGEGEVSAKLKKTDMKFYCKKESKEKRSSIQKAKGEKTELVKPKKCIFS